MNSEVLIQGHSGLLGNALKTNSYSIFHRKEMMCICFYLLKQYIELKLLLLICLQQNAVNIDIKKT